MKLRKLASRGVGAKLATLILSGLTAGSIYAQDGPTFKGLLDSAKDIIIPTAESEYFMEFEYLLLTPELENSTAFKVDAGTTLGRNVDYDYDPASSGRISLGWIKPTSDLGFRTRYWHFDASSENVKGNDSNGLIAVDAISIIVGGGIDDVDNVVVSHDLTTHVLDLEVIKRHSNATSSAGVRFISFDQGYNAYDDDEGLLSSSLKYTGIGPTCSYETAAQIGESNFFLFGSARASAFVGERELSSNNVDTVNGGGAFTSDTTEVAYNADIKFGVEWRPESYKDRGLYTRAGIELQHWGNIGNLADDAPNNIDDTIGGSTTRGAGDYGGDITFHGFFLSTGFEF